MWPELLTVGGKDVRNQRVVVSVAVALLLAGDIGLAENWPNWRGPTRDGISAETNLPVVWDGDRNIAWKLEMPAWSGSTPVIWDDLIFMNVAVDDDNLSLWCIDRNTGQPIWKRHLSDGNRRQQKQNMSSPSPVTDGERVWVMTGTGVLKAFGLQGTELWTRDIQESYGPFGLNWGYASSPLLHEDGLYVQVLHGMRTNDPSYVLRIDRDTGETVWRVERPTEAQRESPDSYTTPALLEYDGTTEIVITGGDAVIRTRLRDRPRAVACRWAQSDTEPGIPTHRVTRRSRRHDLRADTGPAIARDPTRGAWRCARLTRRLDDRPRTRRTDTGDRRRVFLRGQ